MLYTNELNRAYSAMVSVETSFIDCFYCLNLIIQCLSLLCYIVYASAIHIVCTIVSKFIDK